MKKYIILAVATILAGSLYSYSLMDRINGDAVGVFEARSMAMGSALSADGSGIFDALTNPANLTNQENKWGITTSGKFVLNTDNRALPMYNSFDGFSGEATYVSNVNIFDDGAVAAFFQHQFSNNKFAAAVYYNSFINFDSDYSEEVRNNANSDDNGYPPILAKNYISGEGSIDAINFSTAFQYGSLASFGLNISNLYGSSQLEKRIIWSDVALDIIPDLLDQEAMLERDYEAIGFTVGFAANISQRISFGISATPQIDFDVSGEIEGIDVNEVNYVYTQFDSVGIPTDSLTYADYSLPQNIRAGINYRPRNIMKTKFNLDLEYVGWENVNPLFENVFNLYLGVEHKLRTSIPLRFGFNYFSEYIINHDQGFPFASKVIKPTFTAGTGFKLLEKFTLDTALSFSYNSYEALDLFPDTYYDYDDLWSNPQYLEFEDRGWENPDTVNETNIKLLTTISYKW